MYVHVEERHRDAEPAYKLSVVILNFIQASPTHF